MAPNELLTFSSLFSLLSADGLYLLAYGWVFGMSVWQTFFGGFIAYKALPRQHFSNLQHRVFPIYFSLSIVLTAVLLGLWVINHPDVLAHPLNPRLADVAQAYALALVVGLQGSNSFVIGPLTSKTMYERQKLEKEEGKAPNEPGVSANMKVLNKRFGYLHGASSLFNLWAVLSLGFHGLWIGGRGLRG